MKKVLVFLLMICSILVISSCGKKKVLTKRTMEDFPADFSFGEDERGQYYYEKFIDFSKTTKSVATELSQHSDHRWSSFMCTSTKKIKLERISFTCYNKSETETIALLELESGSVEETYNGGYYYPAVSPSQKAIELAPQQELNVSLTFEDYIIKKDKGINLFYLQTDYTMDTRNTIDNIGIYNFKVEYSAYI